MQISPSADRSNSRDNFVHRDPISKRDLEGEKKEARERVWNGEETTIVK